MGRVAGGSTAAVWKGRLARQRRSGLTVAAFCRQEKVSAPSFYQWRRRLEPGARSALGGSQRPRRSAARSLFVPIDVALTGSTTRVEIELPGGAVVRLPADVSSAVLTAAIRAAMSGASAAGEGEPC